MPAASFGFGMWASGSGGAGPGFNADFVNNAYSLNGSRYSSFLSLPGATYTRTGAATALDLAGNVVNFPVRTNLLLRSAEFDNAAWVKTNSTVTADATAAPDGTTTADKLIATVTNGQHRVDQTTTISAGNYSLSVFAKPSGYNFLWMRLGTFNAVFNLTTGATSGVTVGATAVCLPVSNGFFRCVLSASASGSDTMRFNVMPTSEIADFAGDDTSGLFLWGAQLEAGSTATDYIPTTTAAVTAPPVPRVTNRGILIEEARTNLLLGSTLQGGVNQPTWWDAGLNTGTSRGPVASTRGAPGAWQASATNGREFFSQVVTLAANTTYTVSVFVESVSGDTNVLSYATNLPAGATTGSIISPSTPGLYTYQIVVAATAGTVQIRLGLGCSSNNSGAGTVRFSSAQLEAGATPSSYIPTTTAAATRGADIADANIGFQPPTVFVQGRVNNLTAGSRTFDIHNGTQNERITITVNIAGSVTASVVVGGVITAIGSASSAVVAGTTFKAAVRRSAAGTWRLFLNGAAIGVESAVIAQPAASLIAVGRLRTDTEYLMGTEEQFTAFPSVLTDAQLVTLTTLDPVLNLNFAINSFSFQDVPFTPYTAIPGATYTRAGAATAETAAGAIINFAANVPRITDRGVLIEEARTNLLLRSQEFDNASWTKVGSTITPNTTTAPDGTLTAETLIESTDTSSHDVSQSQSLAAVQHTFSAFLKANGRSWVRLFCFQPGNPGLGVWFNVASGTIGTVGAGASNARIIPLANGWYRCSFTFTALAVAASSYIQIATGDNATSTYTGDGTSGVFLWGAQLELGAFPTSYIPTTGAAATRAADVMLVGSLSSFGYPVTLVTRWSRQGGTDAATFYNVASLDRASPFNESAIFQRHTTNDIRAFQRTNGTQEADLSFGTGSIGSVQNAAARFASNNVAGSFNGQTVAVDSVVATPTDRPTTLCVGSRSTGTTSFLCGYVNSVSVLPYAATDAQLQTITSPPSTLNLNFAVGSFTSQGIFYTTFETVPGATYTRAGAATAETAAGVVVNFAANVPRITDRGVLIEEARTNLLLRSQEGSNAVWGNINITVTSATAPDGTATASTITATTTAGTMVNQPVTGSGSSLGNTFSVYVKKGSAAAIGNNFILRNDTTSTNLLAVSLNYDTGVITYVTGSSGASVVALANGWWRISLTATSGISAGNNLRGYIGFSGASATAGDSMQWWGAQLEAGAFATSYIPTTGAAATRAADTVDAVVGLQPPAVFVQERVNNLTAGARSFDLHNGTNNERISVTVNIAGTVSAFVTVGGSQTTIGSAASAVTAGTTFKAAVRRSSAGTWRLFLNGAAVGSESAVIAQPAATLLAVGRLRTGSEYLMGNLERFVAFPAVPTDAQLIALTTL